jgi:hypothetical protein
MTLLALTGTATDTVPATDTVASFGSRGSASWVCLVGLSVFSPCLPIGILVDKDHLWIVGKDFYLSTNC